MSIQAQGSITLVDIGDLGELSVVPQSNLPTMVVQDDTTYTPNWSTNNLILTPVIYYGGLSVTPAQTTSLKWYRQLDSATRVEVTNSMSGHSISNGILTVSTNLLSAYNVVAYTVEVTYTESNSGTALHASGQISFAKVVNGTDGANGAPAKSLYITGNTTFLYNSDNICQNSPITLTAILQNTTFSKWQYKNGNNWTDISGATSNTLVITHDATYITSDTTTIRALATDNTIYDECTLLKIRDGAPGDAVDSIILSNESQMVPCDQNNDPVSGAFTNCTTTITIYEGNEEKTSEWTITVDKNHGVNGTYNSTTHTFSASSLTSTTGYVVFTCTKTNHATLTKTYSLVKVKAGADGTSPTLYELDVDSLVINKAENGTLTPSVINLKSFSQTGSNARTAYTGWLKILNASSTIVSSANASTLSYTIPSNVTKLTAQLCAASNSSLVYDAQTIVAVSDGATGPSGAAGPSGTNGIDGLTFVLGNYQDNIPCTNAGYTLTSSTITIPFTAYQGITRVACTAAYSTLPSGITLRSNTAGTSSAQGTLIFSVGANKDLGNANTDSGTITITLTAKGQTSNQIYTWNKNRQALNGSDGADGYNSATVTRYIRSATTPSKPGGISGTFTYTFATGAVAYNGQGNPLSGWSENIPESNGTACYAIMASVRSNTATATFTWSDPIKIVEDGEQGPAGEKYTIDLNADILYKFYNADKTYSLSQAGYIFALCDAHNNALTINTDYNIIISMLPIADVDAENPTAEQVYLKEGCDNIITELINIAQFPYDRDSGGQFIYGNISYLLTINDNKYTFYLSRLMDMTAVNGASDANRAKVDALKNILRTYDVTFVITFQSINGNQIYTRQILRLSTLLTGDLAAFSSTAVPIMEAVQKAGYNFSGEGLKITNGNLVITNSTGDNVFTFDKNSGNIVMYGTIYASNGSFGGTLTAATGEFSGKVTIGANSTIAGFEVNDDNQLVSTDNDHAIILDGSNGHIDANSITLGEDATIGTHIQLGSAFLYNPSTSTGGHKLLETGTIGTNQYILIQDNGQATFGNININGDRGSLSGTNWYINADEAAFNNIYVSGKIRTAVFEVGHISAVSGAMIFRPAAAITNINPNNRAQVTIDNITSFDVGDLVTIDGQTEKITAIDNTTLTLLHTLNTNIEVGQNVVNLGDGVDDNIVIGVNSMSDAIGDFAPQAISIIELGYSVSQNNTITTLAVPRVILGNLTKAQSVIGDVNARGYGLYADNVFLNGSLTTKYTNNNTIGYAGINTISTVNFNKSEGSDISPIIFWAGSNGTQAADIQDSLFQVSANGTLYAQEARITGSVIANSELRGPKIYGTGNNPALQIFDAGDGIGFYQLRSETIDDQIQTYEEAVLSIRSLGLYSHYYDNSIRQDVQFISIDSSSHKATFIGFGQFEKITMKKGNNTYMTLEDNTITTGNLTLAVSKMYFGDADVEYRQVAGGYDLYVK